VLFRVVRQPPNLRNMAAAGKQADAHPAIGKRPGLATTEDPLLDGGHWDFSQVLHLDPGTVGVAKIKCPNVLGIHLRTETGRQHRAMRQHKTMSCMNVRNLEVDVLHGTYRAAVERPGMDHQLDDVVALAWEHEFHQAQVSGGRLITPEFRASDTITIEAEHGFQLVTPHNHTGVLQMD